MQKVKGVTRIIGEKLCKEQVIKAVTGALDDLNLCTAFFVALAVPEESRYRLLVELPEADAETLASEANQRFCLERGQREGKFKVLALQQADDFAFQWEEWLR